MNNCYFSNEGMTSTTANYYANIAKELQNAALERLNSVTFYNISIAVIGSSEKQIMSEGNPCLDFIMDDLLTVSSMNAFCAWVREAIKEKEEQQRSVFRMSMEEWAKIQGLELPVMPVMPKNTATYTEQDVINSWDINRRNKYLRIEAFAATFGKYIHPEGAYSKARKKAHTALNNPITTTGEGRDMVLYYTESSVDINAVDSLFLALQDQYRSYEKELNQLKAEIKETVNAVIRDQQEAYEKEVDAWKAANNEFNAKWNEMRSRFNVWQKNELERIAKLKIAIPDTLKDSFKIVKNAGDSSK
jgi:hypothetical protein